MPIFVDGGYGTSAFYCCPEQTIDVFLGLARAKRCPHIFRILGAYH
jgi:hypothetical protein